MHKTNASQVNTRTPFAQVIVTSFVALSILSLLSMEGDANHCCKQSSPPSILECHKIKVDCLAQQGQTAVCSANVERQVAPPCSQDCSVYTLVKPNGANSDQSAVVLASGIVTFFRASKLRTECS